MEDFVQDSARRVRSISNAVGAKALSLRDEGLEKVGVRPEELAKLNQVPLIVAIVGLFVNLTLLMAMTNNAWIYGTALSDGEPFTAFVSLTSVKFGTPLHPEADNKYFCGSRGACDLSTLCKAADDPASFPNGLAKNTPAEAWCTAARAGGTAMSLLWLGFLPGLAAAGFTFLYATKEVQVVSGIMVKVEDLGFAPPIQKYVIAGCWGVLWVFMFAAMTIYASMVPDSLGWGATKLDASFGMLRFDFVLISVFGALLASNLFTLWNPDAVIEAWMEFSEAPLLSAKKALYLELMLQMGLYIFLVISYVDWSAVLIVLAAFYLDAKNKNFLLMYLVLVSISILFDIIHAAELPAFASMTPGESFGATLWMFIALLKPLILATIFAYEKYEKDDEAVNGHSSWTQIEARGRDDEIAE